MIYSNYGESAIDYLSNRKPSGITMPSASTCMEQNMFINGIAESAMLNAFEKIGESEKAYYESGLSCVEEGAVFDSIKEMFGKILDAIKEAYEKVITWFAEKQAEVAKYFREKSLDRWMDKISQVKSDTENFDSSKTICKSKVYIAKEKSVSMGKDFDKLQSAASNKAKAARMFAKSVIDGSTSTDNSNALKLEAVKKILEAGNFKQTNGSGFNEVLKNYKKVYVKESESDVSAGTALEIADDLRKTVLAGTQKYYIKKCYNDEKKAINEMVADLKKWADKDDKTVKPKVARCKDITMVMDAVYRTDMEIIQAQFVDARKILVALAKYASSVSTRNEKKEKSSANESASDFIMW